MFGRQQQEAHFKRSFKNLQYILQPVVPPFPSLLVLKCGYSYVIAIAIDVRFLVEVIVFTWHFKGHG